MSACNARRHGHTAYAYVNYGCRCPDAVAARRARRGLGVRPTVRPQPHGRPRHTRVDEVAVLRAVRGEAMPLGTRERLLATAELTRRGNGVSRIAVALGVTTRTVQRYRARLREGSAAA